MGGAKLSSVKVGSNDIIVEDGGYHYHDSYVGHSDFAGQEHVCFRAAPVWSMIYFGHLLKPDLFTGDQARETLRAAHTARYKEGRFLGDFYYATGDIEFRDTNVGDFRKFSGIEKITVKNVLVFERQYLGGFVRK